MNKTQVIRRLDTAVVNRIAAGEVIQRPANALKELLENSFDAKSTNVQISVKQGGLKLLQVQDNGSGIRKEDLEIVCERFTTSKLQTFEDLATIATYGFRGEALASISHVAHLTVITKTSDSSTGFRACYKDSKLKGPPKACAATNGTQIIVEDLFYNIPGRKMILKNPAEEYTKIVDVVGKYAVHNSKVGFSLKKLGDTLPEKIKTRPDSTVVENIKLIYGNCIAKELLEISSNDSALKFNLYGQITNVNYNSKKLIFLLFINNRLVDSSELRKIIRQIYSIYLPKNCYPFVYISLRLDPHTVDVNVHPTKQEVIFLHEETILDKVKNIIEEKLIGSNSSRIFYTQTKLPSLIEGEKQVISGVAPIGNDKKCPSMTIRTDSAAQKLEKFFGEPQNKNISNEYSCDNTINSQKLVSEKRVIKLKSIMQLCADIQNELHNGLHNIIKNFVFVGFVDINQCLLQHDTKLYLCNTKNLLMQFMYQLILYEFGNFGEIKLSEPICLKTIILYYLDSEEAGWTEVDGPKEELASSMTDLLKEKSPMLDDYFSIEIDSDGNLCTLPLIIDKYFPYTGYLPKFITRLCTEVDWNLEKPCLDGISRELSNFYSEPDPGNEDEMSLSYKSRWRWTAEHVLFPIMKKTLLPPNSFAENGTILEIANLPDLYKIFERC